VTELADLVVINKADGELLNTARHTAADYQNALQFMQPRHQQWSVTVKTVSAIEGRGMGEIWTAAQRYRAIISKNNGLSTRRGLQAKEWLWDEVSELLTGRLKSHPKLINRVSGLELDVVDQKVPAAVAARELVDLFTGAKES